MRKALTLLLLFAAHSAFAQSLEYLFCSDTTMLWLAAQGFFKRNLVKMMLYGPE